MKIPYSRPLLPDPIALLPYLHKIHRNRYYSNVGPLVLEFESRLAELFGAPCVTASSCTSALTACLIALDLPPKSFIAVPSWTFPATSASIVSAGHIPYFIDTLDRMLTEPTMFAAWVAVAPFGVPITNLDFVQRFSSIQKIPIIIDAAAGFDAFSTVCKPGKIPVCISTHATKTFGTGEGGFVTCTDTEFLQKVRNILNFGMDAERNIERCGLNGKLSEYHAAVGLAGLDEWGVKRHQWLEAVSGYSQIRSSLPIAQSTMHMTLPVPAAPIVEKLKALGIEAKHGLYGCHTKHAFKDCPRTKLDVTNDLIEKTIYLPLSVDMTKSDIEYVKQPLEQCL